MEIIEYTWRTPIVLFKKLKEVKLLTPNVYNGNIYKGASITLERVNISDILPAQFYMLRDGISQALSLREQFKRLNVDIYNLNGFLEFKLDNMEERFLLPPIIEFQEEYCGCRYPILIDGIHRVYVGKEEGLKSIQAICVRNVSRNLPAPSYSNYFKWNDVVVMDKPPVGAYKKPWRVPSDNAYNYYRNYDEVFPGIGKPRMAKNRD